MKTKYSVMISSVFLMVTFQNCSPVNFSQIPASPPAQTLGSALPTATPGSIINPGPTGTGSTMTTVALKTIRPVFAVRGLNCFTCHGTAGSSVITDFGYGSANFQSNQFFFASNNLTAYNDSFVKNAIGGWQSFKVNNGSLHVPAVTFSSTEAMTLFGDTSITSFEKAVQMSNPTGATTSMVSGVTPPAGQAAVVVDSDIKISYPTQDEILALVPASQASAPVTVALANNVNASQTSSQSGLSVDSSGNFVRNSVGTTKCYGDIVIKGPLLLKNLVLETDQSGCRLYVSQSVFIQGPITYSGAQGTNLQITSARAILVGFSAIRLGALPQATFNSVTVRTADSTLTTAGGPWPRFSPQWDSSYNPSDAPINGLATTDYFDAIVRDSIGIGSEIQDAGDPAAVQNLVTGESIVKEAPSSDNNNVGGPRIAIDYTALLLNAPHVHSRYAGTFKGVIISDVAMLARNTSSQTIEQFVYDPVFDQVPVILPALTTTIISVKH